MKGKCYGLLDQSILKYIPRSNEFIPCLQCVCLEMVELLRSLSALLIGKSDPKRCRFTKVSQRIINILEGKAHQEKNALRTEWLMSIEQEYTLVTTNKKF